MLFASLLVCRCLFSFCGCKVRLNALFGVFRIVLKLSWYVLRLWIRGHVAVDRTFCGSLFNSRCDD